MLGPLAPETSISHLFQVREILPLNYLPYKHNIEMETIYFFMNSVERWLVIRNLRGVMALPIKSLG